MKNTGLIIAVVVIAVLVLLLLSGAGMMGLAGFGMMGPGMMRGGMMGGFGLGGMLFGGLLMLAFWVLVIGGVIWLVVTLARGSSSTPPAQAGASATGQTPVDILNLRYAKGELTKEQFEEMKRDLGV